MITTSAVQGLTYIIKTKTGLADVQIKPESESDASVEVAGRKVVVVDFGCGEHLTVEATPDFYIQKQAPIVTHNRRVDFGCGEHLTVEATPDFYIRKQAPIVTHNRRSGNQRV